MNEKENMSLVAEEALLRSPKKARQKALSVIEDYIDDFEELISKIRMKHDKALPLARSMGDVITDEVLDKSKKDLEKVLRRYRSLTIGKLEELQEQVEDIKNPLKAEDQSKDIIDRADAIHDERYSEIKEFLDKYKPIWVKEMATESVDEAASEVVGDETETDGMGISAEAAGKITAGIDAFKKQREEFDKAKVSAKNSILKKYSNVAESKALSGYVDAAEKATKVYKDHDTPGEDYNKLRPRAEKMNALLNDLNKYHEQIKKDLSDVLSSITFNEYRKDKSAAPKEWILKVVDERLKSKKKPTVNEAIEEMRSKVNNIRKAWTEDGKEMSDRSDKLIEVKKEKAKKEEQERAEKVKAQMAEKIKSMDVYNARRVKENSDEYKERLANFQKELAERAKKEGLSNADRAIIFREWREKELATASYTEGTDDFNEAMEGVEVGDMIAFATGAVIGSLLFNGLIAKKEDVSDRSIPGAKAYRYLLNDEFLKAEKMMKKILGSGKTFEVNKTVAREIHSFKNEYYRPVAYTINKFLDYYDRIKPELFKEKKYYFDTPNTARDEALYKKISKWKTELYTSGSTNMEEKAGEIHYYNPAYDMGTDCDTIRVDAKFLDDILNIDKTFAVLKVIEEAIGDLPDPLQISLYNQHNRALAKYHLPVNPRETSIGEATSPLHAYIMFEYAVAERMKRIRDMFIQYLSIVYDILNYTRFVDKK